MLVRTAVGETTAFEVIPELVRLAAVFAAVGGRALEGKG